jgi:hypothetical protein
MPGTDPRAMFLATLDSITKVDVSIFPQRSM